MIYIFKLYMYIIIMSIEIPAFLDFPPCKFITVFTPKIHY